MKKIVKKVIALVLLIGSIFVGNKFSVAASENQEKFSWVTESLSGRVYYLKGKNKALYWHKINDKYYYFGEDGAMVVGWQHIPEPYLGVTLNKFENEGYSIDIGVFSDWYYFDENGIAIDEPGMYYLNERSESDTNRKQGDIYYVSPKKNWYHFGKNSKVNAVTLGWVFYDNHWYYMKPYDKYHHGLQDVFSLMEGGEMFYGWLRYENEWYHLNTETGRMTTGWLKDNNVWYYLHGGGKMATQWLKYGENWYYLNSNGGMVTGWLRDDNHWYYLGRDGAMKTGWYQVGSKWYFAYSSGKLAIDTVIDGYRVNHNGEWVK